jgi:phosphoserine aminotransferase
MQPTVKPKNPNFSSGPCAKRPGYDVAALRSDGAGPLAPLGAGQEALGAACSETARILGLPAGYRVGIVPASDTGAVEMALWSLLGPRGVDVLAWESFGAGWVTDIVKQLKLKDVTRARPATARLPTCPRSTSTTTWCSPGTAPPPACACPMATGFPDERAGLTICDATSAVFAMELPWDKLDVVTYSWQKVLGGEGAHGMLILSPRAVQRLESYTPPWPMPKIFRMTRAAS